MAHRRIPETTHPARTHGDSGHPFGGTGALSRRRTGGPGPVADPRRKVRAMPVRPIRVIGDPVLHNPCRTVETFDDELRTLVEDMFETMEAADGVGLAANQIGVDLRVFVYDCPDEVNGVQLRGVVVNPVLETSEIP